MLCDKPKGIRKAKASKAKVGRAKASTAKASMAKASKAKASKVKASKANVRALKLGRRETSCGGSRNQPRRLEEPAREAQGTLARGFLKEPDPT